MNSYIAIVIIISIIYIFSVPIFYTYLKKAIQEPSNEIIIIIFILGTLIAFSLAVYIETINIIRLNYF